MRRLSFWKTIKTKYYFQYSTKIILANHENDGELLLSSEVPYTTEMMARLTGHKVSMVAQALEKFKQLNLVVEM